MKSIKNSKLKLSNSKTKSKKGNLTNYIGNVFLKYLLVTLLIIVIVYLLFKKKINNFLKSKKIIEPFSTNLKPVIHYKFENNLLDRSGNNHNGTFFGGTPQYDDGYIDGVKSIKFNGSNLISNNSIVSSGLTPIFGRDAFTISLWINPGSVVGGSITIPINLGGMILFNYGHSTYGYRQTWDINDGSSNPATYSSTFEINKWYHLAAVFKKNDSGTTNGYLKAYLNGILEATHNSVDQAITPTSDLFIGSYNKNKFKFDGKISDVRIYDKALTEGEVRYIALKPVIWYKFHGNLQDSSGKNHHASQWPGGVGQKYDKNYDNEDNKSIILGSGVRMIQLPPQTKTYFEGTKSFTITLWFKSNNFSGSSARALFSTRGSGGSSGGTLFAKGYGGSKHTSFNSRQHNKGVGISSVTVNTGKWYFIAYSHTSSEQTLYIVEKSKLKKEFVNKTINFSNALRNRPVIGREQSGHQTAAYYFLGNISDFRVYDDALKEPEIRDIYGRGDLLLHLPFNGNFEDVSGKGLILGIRNSGITYGINDNEVDKNSLKPNKVAQFNNSSYLELTNKKTLFTSFRRGFTFVGWVKWNSASGLEKLIDIGNSGPSNGVCIYPENNSLVFNIYTSLGNQNKSSSPNNYIEIGKWIHVAVTFDNEYVTFYKNKFQLSGQNKPETVIPLLKVLGP